MSLITVSLRLVVRLFIVKAFGWDDGLMLVAMVCQITRRLEHAMWLDSRALTEQQVLNLGFSLCGIIGTFHGIGQKNNLFATKPSVYRTAMLVRIDFPFCLTAFDNRADWDTPQCWWLAELFYVTTTVMVKFSIIVTLLRIVFERVHRWVLYITAVVSMLFGLLLFIFFIFQCHPISAFWDNGRMDTCTNTNIAVIIVYSFSAGEALTDLIIGILPWFVIWRLNMDRRERIALAGILGIGGMFVVRISYFLVSFSDLVVQCKRGCDCSFSFCPPLEQPRSSM